MKHVKETIMGEENFRRSCMYYSIRPIFVLLERNSRSTNRNSIAYDTGVTGKKSDKLWL